MNELAWNTIDSIPKEGIFIVYLPEETTRKYQVMYKTGNIDIIGNSFAFDLTKPTHWSDFKKEIE